ncbi:hypothetical protein Esti_001498 [Eimeria stiedai]
MTGTQPQQLLLHEQQQQQQQLRPSELLLSAAVSGLVTKTACAPMDRLRLLYQVQGMLQQQQPQQQVRTLKYRGLCSAFRLVVREEGLCGLWRGNGVNAVRAAACYAIKLPANDIAKRLLSSSSSSTSNNSSRGLQSLLLAGALAGSLQKMLSYPLDLLSVRIALGINTSALGPPSSSSSSSSGGGRKEYAGMVDCLKRIWGLEGPRGFFKGYGLALFTGVPYVMLQMTFFDLAQEVGGRGREETGRQLLVNSAADCQRLR